MSHDVDIVDDDIDGVSGFDLGSSDMSKPDTPSLAYSKGGGGGGGGGTLSDVRVGAKKMNKLLKTFDKESSKRMSGIMQLTSMTVNSEIKPLLEIGNLNDISRAFDAMLIKNLEEFEDVVNDEAEVEIGFKTVSSIMSTAKDLSKRRINKVMDAFKDTLRENEENVKKSFTDLRAKFNIKGLEATLYEKQRDIDKYNRLFKDRLKLIELHEAKALENKENKKSDENDIAAMMEEESKNTIEKLTRQLEDNEEDLKDITDKLKNTRNTMSDSILKMAKLMQGGHAGSDLNDDDDDGAENAFEEGRPSTALDIIETHSFDFKRPKTMPQLEEFIETRNIKKFVRFDNDNNIENETASKIKSAQLGLDQLAQALKAVQNDAYTITYKITQDELGASKSAIRQQVKETALLNDILNLIEADWKNEKDSFDDQSADTVKELSKLKLACDNYNSNIALVQTRLDEVENFVRQAPDTSFLLKNSLFSSMRKDQAERKQSEKQSEIESKPESFNQAHFDEVVKLLISNPAYKESNDTNGDTIEGAKPDANLNLKKKEAAKKLSREKLSREKQIDVLQMVGSVRALSDFQQPLISDALLLWKAMEGGEKDLMYLYLTELMNL